MRFGPAHHARKSQSLSCLSLAIGPERAPHALDFADNVNSYWIEYNIFKSLSVAHTCTRVTFVPAFSDSARRAAAIAISWFVAVWLGLPHERWARGDGELFDRDFLAFTDPFEETLSRTYMQQLIAGIAHCHKQGIAHRVSADTAVPLS